MGHGFDRQGGGVAGAKAAVITACHVIRAQRRSALKVRLFGVVLFSSFPVVVVRFAPSAVLGVFRGLPGLSLVESSDPPVSLCVVV